MSIVALQSVTLIGLSQEKDEVLNDLQEMGCLHLRSLKPKDALRPARESLSEETREAWRFLRDCPSRRIQVGRARHYDPAQMQTRTLEIQRQLEELGDERDFLRRRIGDVRNWGDFQFARLEEMNGLRLWFYVVPLYQLPMVEAADLTYELVRRDNRFAYVVVIAAREPSGMPVERVAVGAKSLTELETQLEEVELEMDELQFEREGLTRGLTLYERNMHRLEDLTARSKAAQLTHDSEPVFALQAWAPKEATADISAYADAKGLVIRIEDTAPGDEPPTLLHNPERWEVGEGLVRFYMTPNYRLWDPSLVVLFSFTLFFAMIISDAGYGLLMAIGLFFMRRKLGKTPGGRRMRVLLTLLAGSTIAWGVLVGSYFGVAPPEDTLFGRLHLVDMSNMAAMMKLSIVIGASHVMLANAMDAWRQRTSLSALAPVGWIVVIAGGLLRYLGGGNASLETAGTAGLVLGLSLVFLFAGAGRESGFLKRITSGLMSLARIPSAFGDVLSYLRLFALGLASASLAVAFNGLAVDARESLPGFGFLLAILIIIIGHTLNFVLAIVSGVVHGLRLNVIEFFNWSVTEEGRPFRAFRKKETVT